ncbi:flagellar biosynthesis protein FlhA [Desulfotruncus alcoholivorax]|uniref:flagellar biosynthesis protein FlhA n=1 Tax=Desulfotruncus alcoholivorax TaxID=265477 RepID=UPI0004297D5A|nr:flagellar biosynthesis protein FlhA [Desulfotruncus alcoholivorax]
MASFTRAEVGRQFKKNTDLLVAAAILGIVLLIIIPLPPLALDLFLTVSITVSLLIILITMFTTEPLQFSVFPSLLLVTTLYRLSLNISSTRLILGEAQAGKIINAFGQFVVGGNYVVGAIVFIIITVIQFVVITSGSGRVSEVSARFTLDAMPGKQMSIDAEFNSGLISEEEARERRRKLQREADFFGAMDGASKFVRGDAIAGIVICVINIIGGITIGVLQKGMGVTESLQTYTILTIGDGLVSQIPAVLISTASGILVTRATTDASFGTDLTRQFLNFPKILFIVAGILLIIGFIPAMPGLVFFTLSGCAGFLGYSLLKEQQQKIIQSREEEAKKQVQEQREPENVLQLLETDPLQIEIGYNLITMADDKSGGDLLQRLTVVRRQTASELGLYVRPIRIRDNLQLPPNRYVFKIRGEEIDGGELMPSHLLALNPTGQDVVISGIPTTEPTFGLPAWWITEDKREQAEMDGLTVVDCSTVLVTHLTEFIKKYSHELLGRQDVKELLDVVKQSNPAVVEELVPDLMSVGEVQKVLQSLLKENVNIRDIISILEALGDGARINKDPDFLIEHVRAALARSICRSLLNADNKLQVITLHPKLEKMMADSVQPTQLGPYPVLEPQLARRVLEKIADTVDKAVGKGYTPVLLCSPRLRLPLKRFLARQMPSTAVLSLNEIIPEIEIEAVGTVVMDES